MSNKTQNQSGSIRCVGVGIDTLALNYYGVLRLGIVKQLADLRQQSEQQKYPATIRLFQTEFEVEPHGGGEMFRFLLRAPNKMDLRVSAGESPKTVTVQAYLHACFLWEHGSGRGWEDAAIEVWNTVRDLMSEITKEEPSRADFAADFVGAEFVLADVENIVSRAVWRGQYDVKEKKRPDLQKADRSAFYMAGRGFTGFQFGKGDTIQARCYNKSKEIRGTDKEELFFQVWGLHQDENGQLRDDQGQEVTVWRVEGELKRKALSSMGIHTLQDLKDRIAAIWAYLTERWCCLKEKTEAKQPTRWPIDIRWQGVIEAAKLFSGRQEVRIQRTFKASEKQLVAQIGGCITSLAALRHREDREGDLTETFVPTVRWLFEQLETEYCRKDRYSRDVRGKQIRFQTGAV